MSKKSAHVNNKMDLRINIGDKQVEHITVHPNMFQVPRVGDNFTFVAMTRATDQAEPKAFEQEVDTQYVGNVVAVAFSNAVVRTKNNGRYSTELLQGVTLTLDGVHSDSEKSA